MWRISIFILTMTVGTVIAYVAISKTSAERLAKKIIEKVVVVYHTDTGSMRPTMNPCEHCQEQRMHFILKWKTYLLIYPRLLLATLCENT